MGMRGRSPANPNPGLSTDPPKLQKNIRFQNGVVSVGIALLTKAEANRINVGTLS